MDDAKDAIRRRLAQVKTFLAQEAPPKLSESDTKANFIEPVVAALGWEGIGVVTREYYVRNSQEFIDYVMTGPSGLLLAIEAKPLGTDLTDKHAAQLIQYCAVEGIEWAALTNGRELQFFNTFLKPDLAAKRVLRLDLLAFNSDAEFDALFAQVWQLSRESMTTPRGVRTWLNQRRLDTALRAILLDAGSPTIRYLRKALAEAEISATSQDLAQWFRSHLGSPITALTIPPRSETEFRKVGPPSDDPSPAPRDVPPAGNVQDRIGVKRPAGASAENAAAPLFNALRRAVDRRLPGTAWRTTKYYVAAEVDGHTFLAVKLRRDRLVLGLVLPPDLADPRLFDNAGQFNWGRMTKVARIADEADIDANLLALVAAARSSATSGARGKAYHGVTLRDLIDAGVLQAGTTLVFVAQGGREAAKAGLTPAGEIEWQGQTFRSPSDRAFGSLIGRMTFNGWTHWHADLPEGRESLADIRARMQERARTRASGDAPPAEQLA